MSNELRRYTPLGKPRLTSGHGDVFEPKQNVDYLYITSDVDPVLAEKDRQIARLRKALEEYATKGNWSRSSSGRNVFVDTNGPYIAFMALENTNAE
jgi:hypothetical protein